MQIADCDAQRREASATGITPEIRDAVRVIGEEIKRREPEYDLDGSEQYMLGSLDARHVWRRLRERGESWMRGFADTFESIQRHGRVRPVQMLDPECYLAVAPGADTDPRCVAGSFKVVAVPVAGPPGPDGKGRTQFVWQLKSAEGELIAEGGREYAAAADAGCGAVHAARALRKFFEVPTFMQRMREQPEVEDVAEARAPARA